MSYADRRRRKVLRPFVELPIWRAIDSLQGMSRRQRKALLLAMESCTSSNCWFAEYEVAQLMIPVVRASLTPNAELTRGAEAMEEATDGSTSRRALGSVARDNYGEKDERPD